MEELFGYLLRDQRVGYSKIPNGCCFHHYECPSVGNTKPNSRDNRLKQHLVYAVKNQAWLVEFSTKLQQIIYYSVNGEI